MFYNGLRLDFKRELIFVMKSVKKTFILTLELELSTFKTSERCFMCEIWTLCLQVSLDQEGGEFEHCVINAPRRVNILIMCKLMTLIIRELLRMSTFLLML